MTKQSQKPSLAKDNVAIIFWEDALSTVGWHDGDSGTKLSPCITVGTVQKITEKTTTVALCLSLHNPIEPIFGDTIAIPSNCITDYIIMYNHWREAQDESNKRRGIQSSANKDDSRA